MKRTTTERERTLARIRQLGVLAVLRGPSPQLTEQMVDALVAGGVNGIEITFTTPDALAMVQRLATRYGDDILLGMGTLTEPQQARSALDAGARFLVSPHFEPQLAQAMRETELVTMFGALTPAEVHQAWRAGCDVVKLFPGSLGGPSYLKALRGPYPDIPLMPTGGVSADNLEQWFNAGAVAVGAGSALCSAALATTGRLSDITTQARAFIQAVNRVRTA